VKEGIFIVEAGQKIIAYAVVSNSGEILELCYDPKDAGEKVVCDLLKRIENYDVKLGVSSLSLNAPKDDQTVRKVCRELGYAESSIPYAFQLSIVDLQGLIREILEPKLKNGEVSLSDEILIKVKNSSRAEQLNISIPNDIFQNEKRISKKNDIVIETDKQTISSCIFGQPNLKIGFLERKIKVSPFWGVFKALRLLSLLRLDGLWHIPLSDHG
jgi:hypothetical protein